jgi:uncharacterized protein DUF3592
VSNRARLTFDVSQRKHRSRTFNMLIVDPIKCYVIGATAVVAGFVTHSRKKARLKSWIPAVGSVQNIRRSREGDATAIVRFSDQGGQLRTASMKVADGDSIGLGTELEISYNPRNPEEAFIRSKKDMNLAFYIPVVAGVVLLILGVVSQITLARAGL